jgi:hypothetical protein
MPRAVLCSIGAGPHEELLELARPSFERYAQTFGYDLDLRNELLAADRPPSWSKVPLLRERLEDHKVAIWIDADAVVVDPRADIASTVSIATPLAMVAHNYAGQRVPNCGIMALRRCRTTLRLLDAMWAKTEYLDHKWWENAALLDIMGYNISKEPIVKVRGTRLDRRVNWLSPDWNSIEGSGSDSPIIMHFPGLEHSVRLERMRWLAARSRA